MLHKSGIKLLMAVLLLGFSAFGVKAVTYTVTTTNDSGAGSLRAAVATANGQTANDTIVFDIPSTDFNCTNGVCTIILTSGEIPVNANSSTGRITITNAGGANKIIVSGNSNFRVFNVSMGDSAAFIDSLTISNGNANGTNFNGGSIMVTSLSTSSQALTINNSTISSNTAQLGGALYVNDAKVTITNSTFNNNRAFNLGGAIQAYSENAFVTIINSTFSGNQAAGGGAISNLGSNLTIINSTFSTNQAPTGSCGGIYNFDSSFTKTYIRNTIISANTAAGQPDVCHGAGDTFTSNGNNLIGNTSDTNHAIAWQSSDLLNRQPRLSALGSNGGVTQTHALQSDSDAVNRGNNCVLTANGCGDGNPALTTDQRGVGFNRLSGSAIDIGAFELQQTTTTRRTQFDFDGDGKSDVAVARNNGGNLAWYLLNSQTGFTGVSFGVGTDRIVPADFDGDGKTDVAVVRTNGDNTLSWYILQSQAGFTGQTFGIAGDTPVPADFDGDGKADVAVARSASGALNWYVNRSQLGFTGFQFGAAGDSPIVGDFDGDGKSDAAVARQSNGNMSWYINRSQLGFIGYQFGLATDKPVAGDYDGDGKTDVAVMRNNSGSLSWYLQQSASGFTSVTFGTAGDVAVPADYDGDGKTDVSVFRSSNGTWYLNRSTAGFTGIAFGASTDRAVENAYIP